MAGQASGVGLQLITSRRRILIRISRFGAQRSYSSEYASAMILSLLGGDSSRVTQIIWLLSNND